MSINFYLTFPFFFLEKNSLFVHVVLITSIIRISRFHSFAKFQLTLELHIPRILVLTAEKRAVLEKRAGKVEKEGKNADSEIPNAFC